MKIQRYVTEAMKGWFTSIRCSTDIWFCTIYTRHVHVLCRNIHTYILLAEASYVYVYIHVYTFTYIYIIYMYI